VKYPAAVLIVAAFISLWFVDTAIPLFTLNNQLATLRSEIAAVENQKLAQERDSLAGVNKILTEQQGELAGQVRSFQQIVQNNATQLAQLSKEKELTERDRSRLAQLADNAQKEVARLAAQRVEIENAQLASVARGQRIDNVTPPPQTVTVTVFDKNKVPAGGLTVVLRNTETGGEQKDGTAANTGTRTNFFKVVPGRYSISVPGYEERSVTVASSAVREVFGEPSGPPQTVGVTVLDKLQVPAGGLTVVLRNVDTGGEQKDGTAANTGTATFLLGRARTLCDSGSGS
jgi:hypothetical protein